MNAIYISEFGKIDSLEFREVPDLEKPVGTKVSVRVRATGLNRADLLQVMGKYPPPSGYSLNIPGLEFAGEITEIGDEVTYWQVGDRVFGITAGEAQAEFLSIDQGLLARIPDNLNFSQAAAVPEAFITAHDAIFTRGNLQKGESLLIHAVGSGVGLAALQLAKANGATVLGTSRTSEKLDRCKEFGLDHGIVATNGDFAREVVEATDGRGVNVILDLVGGGYFQQNLASLDFKGRLILVGLTSGREATFDLSIALHKRLTIVGTVLRARPDDEKREATQKFVDDVLPLLASGQVRPNVDRVFKAEDAVPAYEYLGSNESFGKVILEFSR